MREQSTKRDMEAIVKEIEQQVKEYVEVHPESNMFEDEGFDLGEVPDVIGQYGPEWVRPSSKRGEVEILTRAPRLLKKGCTLSMGSIQDSWFISAVGALLYTRPELLDAIFVMSKPALGAYAVRLFVNGAWQVYGPIDDRVVFGGGSGARLLPLFGRVEVPPPAKPELHVWLTVLEKAFARAVGDGTYMSLNTPGVSVEALYTLTGIPVISAMTKSIAASSERVDRMWERLAASSKAGSVITFSRGGNECDPDGVPVGVLFALIGTGIAADGTRLCAVRSCLGTVAWKGRFAADSPEYSTAPIDLRGKVTGVPTAFIIPLEDVLVKFNTVNYLDAPKAGGNPNLRSFTAKGEWTEETAGGCSTFDDTWPSNPQFGFSLLPGETAPVKGYVVLAQYESTTDRGKYNNIGAVITRNLDNITRRELLSKADLLATTGPFTNKREVTCELTIEPGKHYLVVPSTFEPEKIDRFILRVLAPRPLELRELVYRSGRKPTRLSAETVPCSRCGVQCKTGEYFSSPSHPGQVFCKTCMDAELASERVCAFCKGPITAGTIAKEFGGAFYHTDCYRCYYCKASLGKNPHVIDGKLCCQNCGQTCCACGKIISGCVVTVNDKKYHKDCVVCSVCKQVISSGSIFLLGDDLCCESCAQNYQ